MGIINQRSPSGQMSLDRRSNLVKNGEDRSWKKMEQESLEIISGHPLVRCPWIKEVTWSRIEKIKAEKKWNKTKSSGAISMTH